MADPAPALLAITASALERVRDFRAAAPDPSDRVLSVRVTGEADGDYVCALSLEPQAQIRASDTVQHEGDLTIVVADDSVDKLRGATVDWSENQLGGGFVVVNPNKPAPPPLALPTLPMSPGAGPRRPPSRSAHDRLGAASTPTSPVASRPCSTATSTRASPATADTPSSRASKAPPPTYA